MKQEINFEEFLEIEKKLEIRIGQVVVAERVPKSDKMLKLTVIFGADEEDQKTVLTNIGSKFEPDDLLGLSFPFVTNLKPTKMMGIISEAMIRVVTTIEDGVEVIHLDSPIGGKLL